MKPGEKHHEIATSTAISIVELFAHCLREEEGHDAFIEVYMRVRSALEFFDIEANNIHSRLTPGRN